MTAIDELRTPANPHWGDETLRLAILELADRLEKVAAVLKAHDLELENNAERVGNLERRKQTDATPG
jgi:hypothetical protein